jgi:aminoglycoside phosphotransferase family enzyme/predicted kinase
MMSTMHTDADRAAKLIEALMDPSLYNHPVSELTLIETHISWVILTGPYAYKLKKPIDLGFLDFSTLDKRRFYCEEELRLNRRLAPSIYLEVVTVCGTPEHPVFGGTEGAIEYAVKMTQFPQDSQLDRVLDRKALPPRYIDAFAELVADFHQSNDVAPADSPYGSVAQVYAPVQENFDQIRRRVGDSAVQRTVDKLEAWSRAAYNHRRDLFAERKRQGFVRECHGDMHLRNMAWVQDQPLLFDCIEFEPNLRWIDVISDVAFLVMDLQHRGQHALAFRFLNRYLERTGDYAGIGVLPYYLTYRALVRAKVEAIQTSQSHIEGAFAAYLGLAARCTKPSTPRLMITRGLSASGKTTVSQSVLEQYGAIRIRSDVERKRMFGLTALQSGAQSINQGIYDDAASSSTYAKLAELATTILQSKLSVIVDAAFLEREQRVLFKNLARQCDVPYIIIDLTASADTLRQRIVTREKGASDADLTVLEHQLATQQPLQADELEYAVVVDTEKPLDTAMLIERLSAIP